MTIARIENLASADVRSDASNVVIVGHNIIDDPSDKTIRHPALPVRTDTNHINLDGGAYFTKGFLLLNVTDNTIELVGDEITEENRPLLTYACETIRNHLNAMMYEDAPSSKRPKL